MQSCWRLGSITEGPQEARARLADFWRAVSVDGHLTDLQRAVIERLFAFVPREGVWPGGLARLFSPYDVNPLDINPLQGFTLLVSRRFAVTAPASCSFPRPMCTAGRSVVSPAQRSARKR